MTRKNVAGIDVLPSELVFRVDREIAGLASCVYADAIEAELWRSSRPVVL